MNKLYVKIIGLLLISAPVALFAGNEKRSGQAGASELLINPWARSAGFSGTNTSLTHGLEAMNINVAGLSFVNKTEIGFSRSNWFQGSGISINSFGLAQSIGKKTDSTNSVIGISVFNMSFGDVEITTENAPEGGIGTYSPNLFNIGLSFAKSFSKSIHTGVLARFITESTADVKATGFALDAGVQYVAGKNDKAKFGIALRNIGTPMSFQGEGISFKVFNPQNNSEITAQRRSEPFELPAQLLIGVSYDFSLSDDIRFTPTGNFTSNSFTKDLYGFGGEIAYRKYLMVRSGYNYHTGITRFSTSTNANFGWNGGLTFEVPLNSKGTTFGLDYCYRFTNINKGTHTYGVRITL